MVYGLAREAVEAVSGNWPSAEQLNGALERLHRRKQPHVAPEGQLGRSKVAWKIVVYLQVMLYRTVMLADGCTTMWNLRNLLGAILCGRALMESVAQFIDFQIQVAGLCDKSDLNAIDTLIMNRVFGTRLEAWVVQQPDTRATNVLSMIDKIDSKITGARAHYDRLSEMCHPNTLGHYLMFGQLDKKSGVVTLSDENSFECGLLDHIIGALVLIGFFEQSLTAVEIMLPKVVELEERVGS